MFEDFFMKYSYSIVVVVLAIAIAITQCVKEIKDQKETSDREAKLDSTNEELKRKSDALGQMQEKALAKSEDLAEKQAKAIELQLHLNRYVTGGGNKPVVFIRPLPMYVYPGHEKRPRERQEKYKPIEIFLSNNGTVPLRNVKIRISGSLGFEFNEEGNRDIAAYPNPIKTKTGFVEVGPMTLAKDQSELVFKGNYETWTYKVSYACDVMWENGFYTTIQTFESEPAYGAVLALKNTRIIVGNKEIPDPELFFKEE
ncbi:hypothetical protein [Dyadobacter sediminis]|uniref:Uncharacterized protein n=1 Tax=Dyadobacter sediminis TaxID=1493691 RepID=A0A5R9KB37_9BACT|nr:hypothetical protein [Dyadobacter sediminis]TLU91972.1 hypothetical protein FEM55_14520 [Dyadobacter sediminis]GGB98609.1 hypothetical protein GCM10011325_27330 [Dyadobacter sediminis]